MINYFVPVVDSDNNPLMPTTIRRAFRWVESGKATAFYKKRIWCVRLNVEPSSRNLEPVVVGIDPGSKQEGVTVKSESHTYLNLQLDAVDHVKDRVEGRSNARKTRRNRKTPCRQPRFNRKRKKGWVPPSTKARWDWKLRITEWLFKIFPLNRNITEDIAAATKGQRRWDASFSPLEVGKNYYYSEMRQFGTVETKKGWETKALRDSLGLKKSRDKLSLDFSAHCVDSWVLANSVVGGHTKPDNCVVHHVRPFKFHRRQLHKFNYLKGHKRKLFGGTRSMGFKRGSFVKHDKFGICYVGGTSKGRITLCDMNGERLTQNAKVEDCEFLCYSSWVIQ
jgi:RRXRR protein